MSDTDLYFPANLEKQYQQTISKIIDVVNSPQYKALNLITTRPVFVLCGVSGSGKSLSIELANAKLPDDEQIAESNALLWCANSDEAYRILLADDSRYQGAKHIAYSIVRKNIGIELSERFCTVIYVD